MTRRSEREILRLFPDNLLGHNECNTNFPSVNMPSRHAMFQLGLSRCYCSLPEGIVGVPVWWFCCYPIIAQTERLNRNTILEKINKMILATINESTKAVFAHVLMSDMIQKTRFPGKKKKPHTFFQLGNWFSQAVRGSCLAFITSSMLYFRWKSFRWDFQEIFCQNTSDHWSFETANMLVR